MTSSERFIEVATKPLAEINAELQLATAHELEKQIDDSETQAIEAATKKLESTSRQKWIPALVVLMGLVSLPILLLSGKHYLNYIKFTKSPNFGASGAYTDEERLLLIGEPTKESTTEKWRALWESRPDHPPFFVEYASRLVMDDDSLPPDFLEIAERIDPDNGWYLAMAAAYEGKGSVTKEKLSTRDRDDGIATKWTIADPDKHRRSLELIQLAASKPRITNYSKDLLAQRILLLPERIDYPSQFPAFAYIAGLPSPNIKLRSLSGLISAEAQRCGADSDLESYLQLKATSKNLALKLTESADNMIDALIAKAFTSQSLRNFRDTADQFGYSDDAETFGSIDEELVLTKETRRSRADASSDIEALITRKGSAFGSMVMPIILRQVKNPVSLSDDDITPSRRAEHALFGRCASLIIWTMLGLALTAVALYPNRHNPALKPVSLQLRQLLTPADWLWIFLGGLLAPLVWHLTIAQLSPLAAHQWNMRLSSLILPTGQFAATGLLLIIAPVVMARWRLSKRLTFLGYRNRRPWIGWLVMIITALSVPMYGLAPFYRMGFGLATGIAVLACLWLMIVSAGALLTKRDAILQALTTSRILVPSYAAGMIVAIICVPVFHMAEKSWIKHDHLLEISAEEPSLTRFEYRVSQQLKSELLQTFKQLP